MEYSEKEKKIVASLVNSHSKGKSREDKLKLVWWYSFASGLQDDEKTKKIMEDIQAI